ncbi:hypothetical protein F5Y16DRAFT_369665 [Xylariaceae sp. FL0255]|nr:hypothetical protein F5Y16DRAFT_369665 [Xylariaceae sp. FL0255]
MPPSTPQDAPSKTSVPFLGEADRAAIKRLMNTRYMRNARDSLRSKQSNTPVPRPKVKVAKVVENQKTDTITTQNDDALISRVMAGQKRKSTSPNKFTSAKRRKSDKIVENKENEGERPKKHAEHLHHPDPKHSQRSASKEEMKRPSDETFLSDDESNIETISISKKDHPRQRVVVPKKFRRPPNEKSVSASELVRAEKTTLPDNQKGDIYDVKSRSPATTDRPLGTKTVDISASATRVHEPDKASKPKPSQVADPRRPDSTSSASMSRRAHAPPIPSPPPPPYRITDARRKQIELQQLKRLCMIDMRAKRGVKRAPGRSQPTFSERVKMMRALDACPAPPQELLDALKAGPEMSKDSSDDDSERTGGKSDV